MLKKWFVNLLERIFSYGYDEEAYLLEYAKRSRYFAVNKNSAIFSNSGIRHKEIILSDIFHTAEKYVKIYYPNFDEFNSNNIILIAAIKKFLEQDNVECKIILDTYKADSYIIQLFEKYKNVEINILPTMYFNDMKNEFNEDGRVYMVFSDSRMFRLETTTTAYCCFNDEEKTKILEKLFDKYYNLINNNEDI
jgi:hypothetical protein